ncbi:hypothetical protein BE20_36330 [Sorangium cellulosum]|uniref:Uncharacterized protein n=1 Tax=Sorangium cellulosum TaxID=56 RepID=A0A150T063_SORCE|nr:hypothetical protein BE18_14720 [Sorangium cellulosum]KYF98095.1 hypothetical protein BE20_36330 [Sorangium cellulosum]
MTRSPPPFQGGWGHADAPSGSGRSAADPHVIVQVVPSELFTDGVIDLSASRISHREELAYPGCWGTGAGRSGFRGTLEIVSSDDASLFVKLRGPANDDLSLDGDYTVDRCGAATAPAPDG